MGRPTLLVVRNRGKVARLDGLVREADLDVSTLGSSPT
jgi:hypothetical protein